MRRMQFMGDIRDLGALVVSICLWHVKAMKHRISSYKMLVIFGWLLQMLMKVMKRHESCHMSHDLTKIDHL